MFEHCGSCAKLLNFVGFFASPPTSARQPTTAISTQDSCQVHGRAAARGCCQRPNRECQHRQQGHNRRHQGAALQPQPSNCSTNGDRHSGYRNEYHTPSTSSDHLRQIPHGKDCLTQDAAFHSYHPATRARGEKACLIAEHFGFVFHGQNLGARHKDDNDKAELRILESVRSVSLCIAFVPLADANEQ